MVKNNIRKHFLVEPTSLMDGMYEDLSYSESMRLYQQLWDNQVEIIKSTTYHSDGYWVTTMRDDCNTIGGVNKIAYL